MQFRYEILCHYNIMNSWFIELGSRRAFAYAPWIFLLQVQYVTLTFVPIY
jgi:hypothetical protein